MNRLFHTAILSFVIKIFSAQRQACDWTAYPGRHSLNATNIITISALEDCLVYCEFGVSACAAVEFKTDSSLPCWIHTRGHSDLTDIYTDENTTQYIINSSCRIFNSEPTDKWNVIVDKQSTGGVQANYWTELDCFYICQFTDKCIAIDFDITTSPPCWLHWDLNDLNNSNTYSSQEVTQYRLKLESTDKNNDVHTVGRCRGQHFPSDFLCNETERIQVVSSSFKSNPFCCNYIGENSIPPDSSSLPAVFVGYFDPVYENEIKEKCNNLTGCDDLQAKSFPDHFSIDGITNQFCLESGFNFQRTNFVTIAYQCSSNVEAVPPRNKISSNTSNNGGQTMNTTGIWLIIGLVTGLGRAAIVLAVSQ